MSRFRFIKKTKHTQTHTMKNPYYPEDKSQQADWWLNILNHGGPQFTLLGFTTAQKDAITADATWAVYLLRTLPNTYLEFGKRVTGYADSYMDGPANGPAPAEPEVPLWPGGSFTPITTGIEARRIDWVRLAKASPAYNPETIGAVLRLEQTGDPFDPATYKAELSDFASPAANTVTFKFRKARGEVDGINLYLRRKGDAAWTFVRFYSKSPATDTTPVKVAGTPEEREYQGRAVIADAEVGIMSDIDTVLVRA
jgi:hypothetical protein